MTTRSKRAQWQGVAPPHISVQAESYVDVSDPLATSLLAQSELVLARARCFAPWRPVRVPCECNRALENKEGSSNGGGLRTVGRRPATAGLLSPWSKQGKLIDTSEKRETYFGPYLGGSRDKGLRRNGADVEGLGS
jgi:hypothetical protein